MLGVFSGRYVVASDVYYTSGLTRKLLFLLLFGCKNVPTSFVVLSHQLISFQGLACSCNTEECTEISQFISNGRSSLTLCEVEWKIEFVGRG